MSQLATVEPQTIKLDKWKLFDMIGYRVYHDEVRRFHDSGARTKVCSAPRRSTKSYSAAHDVLDVCLSPDTRTWIVGPSYGLAEKEFRYIHDVLVVKRNVLGLPKPVTCMTNPRSGQLFIRWPWGAVVEGKTADRPDSLLGEAVDRVIYSEAAQLPRGIRERYVQPTLVTKKGIEIVPTTPAEGAEWVHELMEFGTDPTYPEIESFHWDVRANPLYDMEEFERARKFYGPNSPVFREQYLGEWVFYAGRVYHTFQEDSHVIKPFEIPSSWPVVRGIDFGHRDPFVTLWCAVGPHNELYVIKEYYCKEGKSIREHASVIKGMSKPYKIGVTVGDPESAQSIDDLCYEGIPTVEANRDRAAGRLRVLEYLLPTEDGPPPFGQKHERPKYPRLYVFDTCKELVREMKYLRWKEANRKEGDREKTEGDDHATDTLRYICMTRPSPFRMASRVPSMSFLGWINRMREQRSRSQYIGAA